MPPHIYIMYMYIVTHAGSSTKHHIIVLVTLAVTVTTLFLVILTVVLVLCRMKKSTHRKLENPVETPNHPRDDHESGLDERGMYFYCAMISWYLGSTI